jgi:RNA polymerase sigma-70 factor (ECF subfamily)
VVKICATNKDFDNWWHRAQPANKEPAIDMTIDSAQLGFESLIAQAKAGCADALAELLEPCRIYLVAIANQTLDSGVRAKVGASDLVQETFLAAQRDLEQFRGASPDELHSWLRRILLNQVTNTERRFIQTHKRSLQLESVLLSNDRELKSGQPSPLQAVILSEDLTRMYAAMEMLTAEQRLAVELRSFQRKPFAEIGKQLGRTDEAARKLWARGIEKLSEIMDE